MFIYLWWKESSFNTEYEVEYHKNRSSHDENKQLYDKAYKTTQLKI